MLKAKSIIVILLSAALGIVLGFFVVNLAKFNQTSVINLPTASPQRQVQNQVGVPQRLIISKINVDTDVESVGQDLQGRMDVPKNVNNVAWYNLGVRPGEQGNAVISGHLDSQTGPAIFYKLATLSQGDEVSVVDDLDKTYRFKVTQNTVYIYNQVPLVDIFGSTDKFRLNLITCGGVFDTLSRNYSQRVVVYTELQ